MRVPSDLLPQIDFEVVVREELAVRNRFLPPNVADQALRSSAAEVSRWLHTVLRREFNPFRQDIILARKTGGGSRPLPFLGLRERLAYRALTGLVVLVGDGSRGDHTAFRSAPLTVENCRYVLKTDVAAFYQYIDHERLVDEVVAQTGDDLAISSAIELMQASSGRRFGLPQMSAPSDALAEIYVDPMRRDLVRAGYAVWRYADDFRVACSDYQSALVALELSERSAYSLGLVLNESKTSTPGREKYEESLSEIDRAERELFSIANDDASKAIGLKDVVSVEDFFMMTLGDYDDLDSEGGDSLGDFGGAEDETGVEAEGDESDAVEPPSERQVAAARRVLELWDDRQNGRDLPADTDWGRAAWSVLLRKALALLVFADDLSGLGHVSSLLVYEPDLTPQVCRYMREMTESANEGVAAVLDEVCGREVVSAWQSLWIAYCAGAVSSRQGEGEPVHVRWLRARMNDPHGSVAAQAALTLAQRRLLSVPEATETYRRVPHVHRHTAFLAVAAAYGQVGGEAPTEDQVETFLASWVSEQAWGRPARGLSLRKRRR